MFINIKMLHNMRISRLLRVPEASAAALVVFLFGVYVPGDVLLEEEKSTTVKIMTYNIKHGKGEDGVISIRRISDVIKNENVDISAIQEVDKGVRRSSRTNQAKRLSLLTGMENRFFGKNIDYEGGDFGNLTMSKFPLRKCTNIRLPDYVNEQRGAIKCIAKVKEKNILLVNTHLEHGKRHNEREKSADKIKEAVLRSLQSNTVLDAVFVSGDFNSEPNSETYFKMNKFLEDSWSGKSKHGYTKPAEEPTKRVDYIFHSESAELQRVNVPKTLASDHLPVVAEFRIE